MLVEPASFRDPSGFLFWDNDKLYRQVNKAYKNDFDLLLSSGLYKRLTDSSLLISHQDVTDKVEAKSDNNYKVIKPKEVPFISYPYEWSFSQLKDAALTTLKVQKAALDHGMTLKDASAYNIQFVDGKPLLIDTLSFESYEAGSPWIAYRQFCQHFLAPLALMSKVDIRTQHLMRTNIDGVPLDLASIILPAKTRFSPALASHIHLHARSQKKYAGKAGSAKQRPVSRFALNGLIDSLESSIKKMEWKPGGTEWGEYYTFTNYSSNAFKQKKKLIEGFIAITKPKQVWDIGANTGLFSRLASSQHIQTIAFDIDPAAVEKNYRQLKANNEKSLLPLVMDLTNPSPALGWAHEERQSLAGRGEADLVMALALIHHLVISNNVPLERAAKFMAQIGKHLIIEFVPKGDSQVDKLLSTREDIFPDYDVDGFEKSYKEHFDIIEKVKIKSSKRILYLMERK